MKSHLLALLISFSFITAAFAQPTLTSANTTPKIGDAFTNQYCYPAGVAIGSGGANQVWDYSALVDSNAANSYKIVSPNSTPYFGAFPTANLAQASLNGTDSAYQYLISAPAALRALGTVTGSDTLKYLNPRIVLPFPFTYESFFTDTVVLIIPTYAQMLAGRDSLYGDGYGTLKLPGQTLSNVLRVKFIENLSTTVTQEGLEPTVNLRSVNYLYFVPGITGVLLSVAQTTVNQSFNGIPIPGGGGTTTSVYYVKDKVLSLQFLSFDAALKNGGVLLQWKTAQEQNTGHFNIQRSLNGTDNFTSIATLKAAGNSSGMAYAYKDDNVIKLNAPVMFYRLQEVDKDGKLFYSGIARIQQSTGLANGVRIYPNPTKGLVNLNVKDAVADYINVYDSKGRLVKQLQNYPSNNLVDISLLPAGTYLIQVKTKSGTVTKKVIKQ